MAHFSNQSEENYLKILYHLNNGRSKKVNNISLAKCLGNNPATVLEMVRKLVSKKLVTILPDKSIKLTTGGEKRALQIIRKHRLWEVFLTEKLHYSWNEVHLLAEQLEHIESNDLIDRLETFLNFPSVDPHGDPIPDKFGKIKQTHSFPLQSAITGKNYFVSNLADTHDDFLAYLGNLKIHPRKKIKIISKNNYDDSVTIWVGKERITLSEKIAKNIYVRDV